MKQGLSERSIQRHFLLNECLDRNISWETLTVIISPLNGLSDEQKELKAKELLELVSSSKTEEEILAKLNDQRAKG